MDAMDLARQCDTLPPVSKMSSKKAADVERASKLMNTLGITSQHLRNAKLGTGVVGRNSTIGYAFLIVALAAVIAGISLNNTYLAGMGLVAGLIIAIFIPIMNSRFGERNPAAALLEGSEFLQYQLSRMASQESPLIEGGPVKPAPAALSGQGAKELAAGEDSK